MVDCLETMPWPALMPTGGDVPGAIPYRKIWPVQRHFSGFLKGKDSLFLALHTGFI
jgi:hypothetical protein